MQPLLYTWHDGMGGGGGGAAAVYSVRMYIVDVGT